jgi:hypothetical protein
MMCLAGTLYIQGALMARLLPALTAA